MPVEATTAVSTDGGDSSVVVKYLGDKPRGTWSVQPVDARRVLKAGNLVLKPTASTVA